MHALFFGLHAGIMEEVACRFVLFALCVALMKDDFSRRGSKVLCLAVMVVPHILMHLPDVAKMSIGNAVEDFVFLAVLFGLPMALLQRKRDLLSAMTMHGFVDFIRFLLTGA